MHTDNTFGCRQFHLLSWLIFGSISLLQAMIGTRFVYSACSKLIRQHYGISRLQLNNLIVASESGRLFEFFATSASDYLPPWMILLIGLVFGSVGYGVQYLCITYQFTFLSFWQTLLLNFLAGNSICWINTYCDLVVFRVFNHTRYSITAVTSSYSGLTGKIYTSLVEGIHGRKSSPNTRIYFLLSCLAPSVIGLFVAVLNCLELAEFTEETKMLPFVFVINIATGVYAAIESIAQPFTQMSAQLRVVSLVLVVMLPIVVTFFMAANQLALSKIWDSQVISEDSSVENEPKTKGVSSQGLKINIEDQKREGNEKEAEMIMNAGEKNYKFLKSVNFWLFYLMNICGATLGMVYLNNLQIISELKGYHETLFLLATSSIFGFFGRIISVIFIWYTREKSIISKPALVMLIMIPMPMAFFLLISNSKVCLYISTGIIATGSAAMSAVTASSTSDFFSSSDSVFIHETIISSNIPIGTLVFGYLAALSYEKEDGGDSQMCIGLECHQLTFVIWGSVSSMGTIISFLLYLRKRRKHSQK